MAENDRQKALWWFLHFFACFRLFFTVFAHFRSFSPFWGCLFLTCFGRPFSHLLPFSGCHLDFPEPFWATAELEVIIQIVSRRFFLLRVNPQKTFITCDVFARYFFGTASKRQNSQTYPWAWLTPTALEIFRVLNFPGLSLWIGNVTQKSRQKQREKKSRKLHLLHWCWGPEAALTEDNAVFCFGLKICPGTFVLH